MATNSELKRKAIFLYDFTGLMARPWLDAGYECWCFDGQPEPLYSQEYVTALLAALEEKDQSIAELNVKLFDQSILLDAAISRAEASGRREEHLKADVAVMAQRNKELESDVRIADGIIANHQKLNAELQQRLQQPI